MKRTRGFIDLVFDAVDEANDLAEHTYDEVVARSVRRFAPLEPLKRAADFVTDIQNGIAGMVFKSIRGINGAARVSVHGTANVAESLMASLGGPRLQELATPMHSSAVGTPTWCVDYLQSTLNGLWGDYLSQKDSELDTGMTVRHHGRIVPLRAEALSAAFPDATNKICVFVHSLAATEWLWTLSSAEHYKGDTGVSFGSRLHDDLDFTPIFVRYNTGLHISDNGRQLANLINALVAELPVSVEEIALVGHSMGGLVARSAASYGSQQDLPWINRLRHVACIGTPNFGAPLEKAVNVLTGALTCLDAAAAQVTARFLNSRSAGIKDLRYGYTVDEEWLGKNPDAIFANARTDVRLLDGVGYYFFAATLAKDPQHPLGGLVGDMLVRLPSASGQAANPVSRIPFSDGKVFSGMSHVHIVSHPDVYRALRSFFAAQPGNARCGERPVVSGGIKKKED